MTFNQHNETFLDNMKIKAHIGSNRGAYGAITTYSNLHWLITVPRVIIDLGVHTRFLSLTVDPGRDPVRDPLKQLG